MDEDDLPAEIEYHDDGKGKWTSVTASAMIIRHTDAGWCELRLTGYGSTKDEARKALTDSTAVARDALAAFNP